MKNEHTPGRPWYYETQQFKADLVAAYTNRKSTT